MLGAGIRIKEISNDYRYLVASMKLRRYNQNYVGSQYGGSLFSMTDPFYMLMLLNILGTKYIVWDKAGRIEYVAPGKTEVTATFQLSEEQISYALLLNQTVIHRRLQARAYPGIARVILNHACSYHEDRTRRHMVTSI